MARIRSIKPEFCTDPKVLDLQDGTALFFVVLWTACDDSGYFEFNSASLAAKTARWRSQEVTKHLRRLHGDGMVKLSSRDGVGMVTTWCRHQRVMKPQRSKWEGQEIQWDNAPSPQTSIGRIGKEGIVIGKEGSPVGAEADPPQAAATPPARVKKPPHPKAAATWAAYSTAYFNRYGHEPIRNAPVNTAIARLCESVGDDAPAIARYYVEHNDSFYVKARHPAGLLQRDYQKLLTDMKVGEQMTGQRAREIERQQTNGDNWDRAALRVNEKLGTEKW